MVSIPITLVGPCGRIRSALLRIRHSGANLTLAGEPPAVPRRTNPTVNSNRSGRKQAQVAADYVRKGSLLGISSQLSSSTAGPIDSSGEERFQAAGDGWTGSNCWAQARIRPGRHMAMAAPEWRIDATG